MFQLLPEQVRVLNRISMEQFLERMAKHLKQGFPSHVKSMDDAQLRVLIESGMKRAASYGIEFEHDIQGFLEYVVVYGLDFGATPKTKWAAGILNDEDLDGEQKIELLEQQAMFVPRKN